MLGEFKVGDKVMLDPDYCDQDSLNRFGSRGVFGVAYVIEDVMNYDVMFYGNNWHKKAWLMRVLSNNKIGGTLNNTQSMVSKVEEKIKGGK